MSGEIPKGLCHFMNYKPKLKVDIASPEPQMYRDDLSLTDLFLDPPHQLARIELVDDPQATIDRGRHDLLDELLCEV